MYQKSISIIIQLTLLLFIPPQLEYPTKIYRKFTEHFIIIKMPYKLLFSFKSIALATPIIIQTIQLISKTQIIIINKNY